MSIELFLILFVAYAVLSFVAEIMFNVYYDEDIGVRIGQTISFCLFGWLIAAMCIVGGALIVMAKEMRVILKLDGDKNV